MKQRSIGSRVLSVLLLLSMLLSLLPVGVFAQTGAEGLVEAAADPLAQRAAQLFEQINELSIPYTELYPISENLEEVIGCHLDGKWFILHKLSDGSYVTFDHISAPVAGDLRSVAVTVENDTVQAEDLTHAVTLFPVEGKGYTIRSESGNSVFFYAGGALSMNKPFIISFVKQTELDAISLQTHRDNFYSISNYQSMILALTSSGRFSLEALSTTLDTAFYLYRVSPVTLELYEKLRYMQSYVGEGVSKRYAEEDYTAFLDYLQECIDAYNAAPKTLSDPEQQAILEEKAATLRSYVDILMEQDRTKSYIDIPMEILDFRADTFLAEFSDAMLNEQDGSVSRYAMAIDISKDKLAPGYLTTKAETKEPVRRGLVEPTLIDGRPVYKPETVQYVAQLIKEDIDLNGELTNFLPWFEGVSWNQAFRSKISSLHSEDDLGNSEIAMGSFGETLKNTIPNDNGEQVNGCVLLWDEVETATDLAYYGLNNLWRAVDPTDTFTDGTTYNVAVPQRDTLRLYLDEKGSYTIDSNCNTVYDGYRVYNTVPHKPELSIKGYPRFTPINGLGFEAENVETDLGGHYADIGYPSVNEGTNYLYSIHAHGSFVYYRDQNQYFDFIGDDDVYFYIDGKLVMDLGGTHSPAGIPCI